MDDSGGLWLVDAYNLHYQDRMTSHRYISQGTKSAMKVCEGMHYCNHKFQKADFLEVDPDLINYNREDYFLGWMNEDTNGANETKVIHYKSILLERIEREEWLASTCHELHPGFNFEEECCK